MAAKKPKRTPARQAVRVHYIAPMKPTTVDVLPADAEEWLYEVKFDGYRAIALKSAGGVELWSSTHKPLKFPEIEEALACLACDSAVLDGEICALDDAGRSSFQLLQQRGDASASAPICIYLFDLLELEGERLTDLTTAERKERLATLVANSEPDARIRLSPDLAGSLDRIVAAAKEHGLEGIVAKRRDSVYAPGTRTRQWEKFKLRGEQEFVIGGYTEPEGSRKFFGALLVGYHEKGKLRYAAKAGSGYSHATLERLFGMFQKHRRKTCPFVNLPEKSAGRWGQGVTPQVMARCTWIDPIFVAQIRFAEWTMDGGLRQPTFLGLREDKPAKEVVRERPIKNTKNAKN